MDKLAKTSVKINDLIARRWSARAYNPNIPIEGWKIISLCEAARWAPSCAAEEPWRFIVWDKNRAEDDFQRAFDTLDEGNRKWVKNAQVLIAVLSDTKWRNDRTKTNKWAPFDTGAAAMSIYLQAFDLGLYAHPMAGFDADKLRLEFQIPEDYEPYALIAVGYPGNVEELEPTYRQRELGERKRRPLEENFYFSKWGEPIKLNEFMEER
ncbi:MAG: nitroreductase family protein [Ignavibacteria bacterium]|nr:nitroreductase family protein [Ignavibacteria bacterium]